MSVRQLIFILATSIFPVVGFAQRDTIGLASFYAKKFEGRKTSSGEIFHHDSLTAAHKTWPFGTFVRITNLHNDSSVVVRINDRLPKSSKRSIDLTRRAAQQLNFVRRGVTKVRLEIIQSQNKKGDKGIHLE
jgi:rare lipoprotein A